MFSSPWRRWLTNLSPIGRDGSRKVKRGGRRPLVERLEDRLAPATLYVDNPAPGNLIVAGMSGDYQVTTDQGTIGILDVNDTVTWNPGAGSAHGGPVTGLNFGTQAFGTIQDAINAAVPMVDEVRVAGGTFSELVTVNKSISVLGNQTGVDARTRTGAPESIVDGTVLNPPFRTTAFNVTANDATIDGFTARDQSDNNVFNAGIVLNAVTGATVQNNIIANNVIGIFTRASASMISQNLFDGNNTTGPGGAAAIYSEGSANLTVDNNSFINHTAPLGSIIRFVGPDAVSTVNHTNLAFTNNLLNDNGSGVFAMTVSGGLFQGNTITTNPAASALTFGEAVTNVDVLFNNLSGNLRGLRIAEFGFVTGTNPSSNIEARYNDFSGNTDFGAGIVDSGNGLDGYTGTLDLSANWWGDVSGPTSLDNLGGLGTVLRNDFADVIDFRPWLVYAPDSDPAIVGVQLPATVMVTAGGEVSPADNDYTRLMNAVAAAAPGQTIQLSGIFDWTQPNAAAAWALGNDGVVSTDDDYSILVTPNVNDVTVTASSLGSATIQGPGDLANANLEGVFVFDGGDNQNWTISNLEIFDFDLSIGMFNGAGGSDAYNGTILTNNSIRVPADLNATVAPLDVNQNIGIHFSFGTGQTISDNQIELDASGASDTSNPMSLRFASVVGMQSNTSGGAVYDGLLIDGNVLTVTGAQAADPSTVLGIWENAHGHTSDITVSNNQVLNQTTGGTPATNLIRAFRVTSHSSLTTTVAYTGNTVDGANIGFQWLAGQNFAGNQPVQLTQNTITNSDTGVLVQSNGVANLFQNTITGSGTAGIDVASGMLTAAGTVTNAVQENFISGGSGDGIRLASGVTVSGGIFNNDLGGNTGLAINNQTALVDASGNWYGTNTAADVAAEVSLNVDYTPWLHVGTDTSADPGFQGDFSTLHVDDDSPQTSGDRIAEGIALTTGATPTVIIEAGTYAESVAANKAGLNLQGTVDAAIQPPGLADGITVSANDVTISNLAITGGGNAIVASGVTPLTLVNLLLSSNVSGGTLTNVATVEFTASPAADTITVSGTQFGATNVQAISYTGVTSLITRGGLGADTFVVAAAGPGGPTINIDGDAPTSGTGDALNYNAEGRAVSGDLAPPDGFIDSPGVQRVNFTEIETVNILNSPTPTVFISDATANEADGTISFTVTLDAPAASTITVPYSTQDDAATAPADYASQSGFVIFTPGVVSQVITINLVDDVIDEPDETFFVNLATPSNAALGDDQAVGTITDNATPTLAINSPAAVIEGNTVTFTVTLSAASGQPVTVDYSTASGTATAPGDFTPINGTVTFAPGQTTRTITVSTVDDAMTEGTETFFVNLTNATNATVTDGMGDGTITDNDAGTQPTLSINDVTQGEGDTGTTNFAFTVSLSAPSGQVVMVAYATATDTADGADFSSASGILTFQPGQTSQTVSVSVNGDTMNESNERFLVNLSGATNATISDSEGVGTITNDDPRATLSITDVTQDEGTGGTTSFVFTVFLTNSSSTPLTVDYATADGSATNPADYLANAGTLTFAPGVTSQTITVVVTADNTSEPTETFFVNLSNPSSPAVITDGQGVGTITNDDDPPMVSVGDVTVNEADGTATFLVTLSNPSTQTVTVNFATANGTATSPADYASATGTVTFAPSVVSQMVTVGIANDNLFEPGGAETFFVNLSDPTNATPGDGQGVGTITDNDATPTLTVADASGPEGGGVAFTVTLSNPTTQPVVVTYSTADQTATAPGDYTAATSQTITIAPGTTTGTITIATAADTLDEPDETFLLNVSATDATVTDGLAVGTILDGDSAPVVNDQSFAVAENSPNGTPVGLVAANDPNNDPLAYAITGGNTGGAFAIDPATGQLTVANSAALDFETNPMFTLTVQVSDGTQSDTAVVTVNLGNVAESLPVPVPQPITAPVSRYAVGAGSGSGPGMPGVVGPGSGTLGQVRVYDAVSGAVVSDFQPYGSYEGGVTVAMADVNADGTLDVITGAGPGAPGGHVKVFDGVSGAEIHSFFAFAGFDGGVTVAAGDVNGDGRADVIVGAGPGAPGGHVKVFDGVSGAEIHSFFAFAGFTGGVTVAAGNVDNAGFADVIVGAGPGAPGGHVKVFDGLSGAEIRSFFAYSDSSAGVFVAAGDVDGDGNDDLITGRDAGLPPLVRVFSGASGAELGNVAPYPADFHGGVRVGSADLDGDGLADLLTGAGPGAGPHVKGFSGVTLAELDSIFAFSPDFSGGVYVGGK